MARIDRTGNRKSREQRKQFKVPELGYYLIVTDTEATERCFFTGLHQALPEDVRNKLVIKVVETKTRAMIDKCLELTAYDAQYRIPWIVFDRDQVQGFDEIIKEAEDKGIQVGWMIKKYYEDARENAAFERYADVITSLIVKYGPSLKRRWELEAMMKNIGVECFWKGMTYKRYYHYYKLQNQVIKEKSAA